jgi:hypothetical protein
MKGMGRVTQIPMQMPSLCAKCGERPPTDSHTTQARHRNLITGRTNIVSYSAPVCADCQTALKSRARTGMIVMIIGIGIFLVGLALLAPYFLSMGSMTVPASNEEAIALSNRWQQYTPGAVIAVGGILIAMAGRWFGNIRFARWNGRKFRFNNSSFHSAFAELNPAISR